MQTEIIPMIEEGWKKVLHEEFEKDYFLQLKYFLSKEYEGGEVIFPPSKMIYNAFEKTPFNKVKVIILGQDPYHATGQAHGLCFSVLGNQRKPPSLVNIFKEINSDLGIPIPASGDLTSWARQGVLLLNATLTVRANKAGSHQKKGWEIFTDTVIKKLSDEKSGLIFLLWGRHAREKVKLIDSQKHHVLESAHPSPLSAYNGFFGSKHFSKVNILLLEGGNTAIDWNIS